MKIKYTALKSTNRQNLKEILPLKKPFTLLIEPSSLCNFRCIQCFQSLTIDNYFTRTKMNMPINRFKQILGQLKIWKGPNLKVLKLNLYGEPFMSPDFYAMLKLAKEADIAERIETTTNAFLLNERIAEELVRLQLDYVRVSIYAVDQKTHEERTGVKADFRIIYENLKALKNIKRRVNSLSPFVSCKMLDSFGEENKRFEDTYREVCDEVYIEKPHNWLKVEGVNFMQNYYQDDINKAVNDFTAHTSRRIACPMPFTTMAVRSNGDVSPCCVDFIGGTNLGNVDKNSLEEIWNSDKWFEFQKMQLEDRKQENYSCARCDIYLNDYYTLDNIDGFPVEKLR